MTYRETIWLVFVLGILPSAGCATVATQPAATPPTSASAGDTTIVAVAPANTSCSIYDVLGVHQAAACTHKVRDCIAARLGMLFPGLEPKPALKLIADPANLSEDAPPTVKTAAEIKQKEDQAEQKIKGIRYLATIGCGGCYAGVEEALLASLEDCTEEVRYETAIALRKSVGRECRFCAEKACCSEKVQKKLYEMNDVDSHGCYKESSERVRRQARLVLRACGPVIPVADEVIEQNGSGQQNGETVIEGPGGEDEPIPPPGDENVEEGADPNEIIPPPPSASYGSGPYRLTRRIAIPVQNVPQTW